MKKPVLAAMAALGVAALVAPTTPAAAVDTVDSSKLREAVTVNGILQHERALYAIAAKNDGTRASGTKGYDDSVDVRDQEAQEGRPQGQDAVLQVPAVHRARAGRPSARPARRRRDLETATFDYSRQRRRHRAPSSWPAGPCCPPTPEPSSASGCAPGDFPAAPSEPAVALVQRGTCDFAVKVDERAGRRLRRRGHLQRGPAGARRAADRGDPGRARATIPVVGVSFATGDALAGAGRGRPGEPSASRPRPRPRSLKTKNIIADTPEGQDRHDGRRRGAPRLGPRGPGHQRQRQRHLDDPRDRRADEGARLHQEGQAAAPGALRLLGRRGGGPARLGALRRARCRRRRSRRSTPT